MAASISDELTSHINIMLNHMITHLNYQPIKCVKCSCYFHSIYEFVTHGQCHTYNRELDFEFDPKPILEEWVSQMMLFLGSDRHLKINENKECLVCQKYKTYFESIEYKTALFTLVRYDKVDEANEFQITQVVIDPKNQKLKKLTKEQIILIYHVHHHLQYYPYRCCVKDENEEKMCGRRFAFIGREYYIHLKKTHGIEYNLADNNVDCFEKEFYIEMLDKKLEHLYRELPKEPESNYSYRANFISHQPNYSRNRNNYSNNYRE